MKTERGKRETGGTPSCVVNRQFALQVSFPFSSFLSLSQRRNTPPQTCTQVCLSCSVVSHAGVYVPLPYWR